MQKRPISGIVEGLELAKVLIESEAATAFLNTGLAKNPYPPQRDIINSHQKVMALFGGNRCLHPDSLVHMADGTKKKLRDMEEGEKVLAWDRTHSKAVVATVTGVFCNGEANMVRYRHANGELVSTCSHKVCVLYPSGRQGMIRAYRAVKKQLPVIIWGKNGVPAMSLLKKMWDEEPEHSMDLGIDHPDHCFFCDNIVVSNSGKSHVAAHKVAWDATGLYPEWYTGPRTHRGIDCWVLGTAGHTTREVCQNKLFGTDPDRPGWTDKPGEYGLINSKYIIGKPTRQSQPPGMFDMVRVKHVPSDTVSTITFKSHKMERQALAGWHGDLVWIDEECTMEIFNELKARLMDNNGRLIISLCPIDGMTPLVKYLLTSPEDLVMCRRITHKDIKHIDQKALDDFARSFASNPAELAARTEGLATTNSGLIFPFLVSDIMYDPKDVSIPSWWKRIGGLDVGWKHPTAAVACAYDAMSDIIYCYACYEQSEKPYLYHHAQLNEWGINMRFMIDPASSQSSTAEGEKVLEKYWEAAHGQDWHDIEEDSRKYVRANNKFQVGMDDMWHRFSSGRLRINKNLTPLLEQYGTYAWNKDGTYPKKETPDLKYDIITALRYAVLGVHQYAHRIDEAPPWKQEENNKLEIESWKPYRCGRR